MFLISVITGGRLRYRVFKNTVKLDVNNTIRKIPVLPEAASCTVLNICSDISGIWRRISSKSRIARKCQCMVLKTSVRQILGYYALPTGKDVNIFRTRKKSLFSHHH